MNHHRNPATRGIGNGVADTPEEELVVIFASVAALGIVVGSITIFWEKVVTWLLEQDLLVPASGRPLIVLPETGGAGLDLVGLSCTAGVLLAVVTVLVSMVVRAIVRRRRAEELL